MNKRTIFSVLAMVLAASIFATARAQVISIADPGLESAIRQALQKPVGPLSQQDLLALTNLDASDRGVNNLAGLDGAHHLTVLNLQSNRLANLSFPIGLTNLSVLDLSFNPLTNCVFPAGMTKLTDLAMDEASLVSLILPADMARLNNLDLAGNQLTDISLPSGLTNLNFLLLEENQLTNLALPAGLTSLGFLDLSDNQLDSLTLPSDMTNLSSLFLDGNPFTALVLSESMAATDLADVVADLNVRKISVFTFPLTLQLVAPRLPGDGSFQFAITAPPGVYAIFTSSDLVAWNKLAVLTNQLGVVRFFDGSAPLSPQKFYRAELIP